MGTTDVTREELDRAVAEFKELEREVDHLRAEFIVGEADSEPLPDEEYERLSQTIEALDDETLVYTLLGLISEVKGAPGWGRSVGARTCVRVAFGEIAARWIPEDVLEDAAKKIGIGEPDDAEQECRDCGKAFPYDENADYCPACVAAALGEGGDDA